MLWIMKKFTILLPFLSLALIANAGQTNQLNFKPSQARQTVPSGNGITASRTNGAGLFHKEKSYGGALPELKRRKTHFFRPTPGERQLEFQNVSVNPHTGRAEGLILFSIGF